MMLSPVQPRIAGLHRPEGINQSDLALVVDRLTGVVADTAVLWSKTLGFHWNVQGPHFVALHDLFERRYQELHESLDSLAERLRQLGRFAPTSLQEMIAHSAITEELGVLHVPRAETMVSRLYEGHVTFGQRLHAAIEAAEAAGDVVTADLLVQQHRVTDQFTWILSAWLAEQAPGQTSSDQAP